MCQNQVKLWGDVGHTSAFGAADRVHLPFSSSSCPPTPLCRSGSCLVLPSGQPCVPTPPWGADMCERYAVAPAAGSHIPLLHLL